METKTKEYEIYAGIGSTDNDVELIDKVEFDSFEEALEFAEYSAFGLYNFNPTRDIFEIMKEDNVNEEEAMEIFKKDASDATYFFVISYEEDGEGNKVMTRHTKG